MKPALLFLISLFTWVASMPTGQAQCNASFTWEQIPNTLQIHFNSTSTSEHDITSYQWNFGDGHMGDGDDPYHTYDSSGVYVVCLIITDSEGCMSDVCHEVTVEATSSDCEASFTWEQIPNTFQIHFNSTSTSEFDITSYHWNFGDGTEGDGENPYHTYDDPGTYVVCLIIHDAEGCASDVCHEVTVEATSSDCEASFTWEQIPNTFQIHFNSTSTSEFDITSYHWNFGDGTEGDGENPYHTYDEPGTYLVCLIIHDAEGCASDVCHEVTVEGTSSECEAGFTWEQFAGTYEVDFTNTSTSDHDIISFQWNFGDGFEGDGPNPSHTYDEPGVYVVCLTIENEVGCVDEACHEVVVESSSSDCEASFTWEQIPNTLQIHFNSTSTSEFDITSYQWNFGDGHNGDGENPYHIYDEPGTYLVCLIIHDAEGCVSDVCHEVTVEEVSTECHASFTWEQAQNSLDVHFFSTSTSGFDITSYQWNFGDGHTGDGNDPHHTYEEPGVYVVCLIITDANGCMSDVCHEVHVEEVSTECHASFTWEQFPNSLEVVFHSTSTSGYDITSYQWNFGDGHTGDGPNPHHTYEEPGVYVVCLIITDANGCVSDVCHEVHVEEASTECHASFTWEQEDNSLEVHFHSTSTSGFDITSYQWNFGDGHTGDGANPTHNYEEPGVYVVCLIITDANGCMSDVCHEVHVEEVSTECHASFTWEQFPNSLEVVFHSTSTSGYDITSYQWNFGDGHNGDGPNPHHTYEEPGVYVVCLIITDANGCMSDICHEVHVEEPGNDCEAHFNWETNAEGVVFFNNTSSGATDHTTWFWDFGDGNTSTEENPQHTYDAPGNYTVCLTMTDTTTECSDDFCETLEYEMGWQEYEEEQEFEHSNSQNIISDSPQEIKIIHYTNPVMDEIRIDYLQPVGGTDIRFDLYDLNGHKMISKHTGHISNGRQQERMDVRNLQPGLYILYVTTSEKVWTLTVYVNRER